MHWLLLLFIALIFSTPSSAQLTATGVGGGFGSAGGASYSGPGDVVSSATAWGSVARVYTVAQASTSTSLADLVATTGGAAVCTLRGSASGFVDLAASYCAGTTPAAACAAASGGSCKVTKLYDQTGNGNHWTQATLANMPTLSFGSLGGFPTLTSTAGVNMDSPSVTIAQPLTVVVVSQRSAGFTSIQRMFINNTAGEQPRFGYNNVANQVALNAGSIVTATASDSAFHAFVSVVNNASSSVVVDGAATTGTTGTAAFSATPIRIMNDNSGNELQGSLSEIGFWPSGFNATQYGNMNTNIHSATSGYNF